MTATLEHPAAPAAGLRSLNDDDLAGAWRAADVDDPAVFAEFMREFGQRTRTERLARAREALAVIRAEGELAAHAQYLKASEWTRGRLLSRAGMAASIREEDLWRMPEDQAMRFASEETRDYWLYVAPRITPCGYVRQRAAESRAARTEAMETAGQAPAGDETVTETDWSITDEHDHDGPGLDGDAAGALRLEPAAPQAPQRPGGTVQRGGRGPGPGAYGQPGGAGTGRPAGPPEPPRGVRTMAPAYTTFGEIEPLKTEYLLAGFPKIPRGDVTLFFGDGSVGKGRMICSFIAEVVNAGGTVLTVLPEDHPNEEIAPRLRAAGVSDLSKVIDLTRLPGGSRLKLSADMTHDGDVSLIRQAIEELTEAGHQVRMLVIDPLAAVVGWGSINTNAGARRLVEPLQDLAMSTGIAVCVVAHTVKSGVLQGSAGLQQALRLVYRVSRDPANPVLRILHAEKANNLVAEDLRFAVEQGDDGHVRVVWLDRAEQDRRNKSWRTPAETAGTEGLAATLAGVRRLGEALRDLPRQITVTRQAGELTALMGIQRPGEARPEVHVLARFPAGDAGTRLARMRCESHPRFRWDARWQQGRDGGLLSKYTTADGTVIRFGVTAVAN